MKKALMVEDDPICQKSQKKLLAAEGFEVDIAASASEALNLLNDQELDIFSDGYNIILMDIILPDIDGDRLTEFIRENELKEQVPIIAVTSHVTPQLTKKFKKMGITDVIFKPMTKELLHKMLAKYN